MSIDNHEKLNETIKKFITKEEAKEQIAQEIKSVEKDLQHLNQAIQRIEAQQSEKVPEEVII